MSFILPKNKSNQFADKLGFRTLFNYYAHPLRWWGRLIGRCLNQMVRASENCMPSLNMSDMTGMLSAVRYWNQRLTEQGDDPRTRGLPVELWELDVVQMYPSLDRAEVLQAVQVVHDAVLQSQRRYTAARQHELVFFINKVDQKLDRIGQRGDHSCYHVIPFAAVLPS